MMIRDDTLNRRRFLKTSIYAPIAVGASPSKPAARFLLLDSRVVERTNNTSLVLGTVKKDPARPLFREDKPWEPRFDNLYANVMFDREEGIYKCWYSPFIVDPVTTNTPRERRASVKYTSGDSWREMGICYAVSKDGISWEKPSLGLVEFQGNRDNNLVLRADPDSGEPHGAGISKDLNDPDPNRQYKMFFNRFNRKVPRTDPRYRYMCAGFSRDGLIWKDFQPCRETEAPGDTHSNWFWAPELSRYVGITRLIEGQRLVARTESQDFLHWTKAQVVLRALPGERNRQTYAMPSFPYANVYLGLVMMINKNGRMDTVDCELAWSPDTVHWERICPGTPLIPRGPEGAYDSKCLYAAFQPIVLENEIRLYYGGNNGEHTDFRDGFFCLARLRPDGFAAMAPQAGGAPGEVLTRPLTMTGRQIRISADAAGGLVTASIVDPSGRVLAETEPLRADVTSGLLRWKKLRNLARFAGLSIQLRFHLEAARLYAFSFTEA